MLMFPHLGNMHFCNTNIAHCGMLVCSFNFSQNHEFWISGYNSLDVFLGIGLESFSYKSYFFLACFIDPKSHIHSLKAWRSILLATQPQTICEIHIFPNSSCWKFYFQSSRDIVSFKNIHLLIGKVIKESWYSLVIISLMRYLLRLLWSSCFGSQWVMI